MTKPLWLTKEFILALHERLIAEFGGISEVRDHGLLESALDKPRNMLAYAQPTIIDLAAAYAFGIAKNHPFMDGNKRTGFVAATAFLNMNGFRFLATEEEATAAMLALAAGDMSEEQFAAWLVEKTESEAKP